MKIILMLIAIVGIGCSGNSITKPVDVDQSNKLIGTFCRQGICYTFSDSTITYKTYVYPYSYTKHIDKDGYQSGVIITTLWPTEEKGVYYAIEKDELILVINQNYMIFKRN